jgi:hypothetical protein
MDAARYVDQVDRVLAAACDLLPPPDGTPAELDHPPAPVDIPEGRSGLAAAAAANARRYQSAVQRVRATHEGASGAVEGALEAAREAARTAEGIRGTAQLRAAALLPAANTPAGLQTLVDAMASSLASMQNLLSSTRAQMSTSAGEIRRHSEDWRGILDA